MNPRPLRRARVLDSPRSQPDVQAINTTVTVHPLSGDTASSSDPPATDTLPLAPARRRVPVPGKNDRLSDLNVIIWQNGIHRSPEVSAASDAVIRGSSVRKFPRFLIVALDCLALDNPVPVRYSQLKVAQADIPSIYSLLVPHPIFRA